MNKERSVIHKVNQEAYAITFKTLIANPCTAYELAEETGLHVVTMQELMRCFARHKLVHISAWDQDTQGRDTTPVWTFGKGKNVPRRRQTRAEIAARYRERQKMLKLVNLTPTATTVMKKQP